MSRFLVFPDGTRLRASDPLRTKEIRSGPLDAAEWYFVNEDGRKRSN